MKNKVQRVVLSTLRYSDNLGDGVIGDCVEFLLKKYNSDIKVYHLDMAGRTEFLNIDSTKVNESIGVGKTYFYKLPYILQKNILKFLLWPFVYKKRLSNVISNAVSFEADLLMFGGGQVLNDVLLNFPLKFNYVCESFIKSNTKVIISGMGVSKNWSPEANKIFNKFLNSNHVIKVHVRDKESKLNLIDYGVNRDITVTLDPAIWAKETYNITIKKENEKKIIGLGIANPHELAVQAESNQFKSSRFDDFWLDIIDGINLNKYEVHLFTNGSSEDYHYLQHFSEILSSKRPNFTYKIANRPLKPVELVNQLAIMDLVVAHRLHANIISYSLGIPSIALEWDKKVRSFCQSVQREKWCFTSLDEGKNISGFIETVLDEGVDPILQKQLKNICFENIKDCLEVIEK